MELCEHSKCTGCGTCSVVCTHKAISFKTDSLGFRYPEIDTLKCVDCGLCKARCPSISPVKREIDNDCYLAWAKDDVIHYESSSGGIAFLLQRYIIERDGYSVGCVWDADFNARLVVINHNNELVKTIGSKYVQSYIADETWNEIEERDKKGQKGIFIGLPCQVAAVKSFTNGSLNILFVDLLCHGGCSPSCLKAHLACLQNEKKSQPITDVRFRGGKYDCKMTLWSEASMIYKGGQFTDKYFYSFMKHGLFQESCYQCQYANSERLSDITLADFWGVDQEFIKGKHKMNGANLVLIHSDAGRNYWNAIKEKTEYYKRPFEEAMLGNDTLREPTFPPADRERLLSLIGSVGFEKAVSYDNQYKRNIRNMRMGYAVKMLKKIMPRAIFDFLKKEFAK